MQHAVGASPSLSREQAMLANDFAAGSFGLDNEIQGILALFANHLNRLKISIFLVC
jgi:hypothetical protein